jgi:hypothetical protein
MTDVIPQNTTAAKFLEREWKIVAMAPTAEHDARGGGITRVFNNPVGSCSFVFLYAVGRPRRLQR